MKQADQIVRPPALRSGDAVAVVAPAGPFDSDLLEQGVALWRAQGFDVRLHPELNRQQLYFAGDDQHRLTLLNTAFADPEIKAVIAARGGYGSLRLLDDLAFDSFLKRPKIVVGFSDITALQLELWRRGKVVTFSGPMMASRQFTKMKVRELDVYFATLRSTEPPPALVAKHVVRAAKQSLSGRLIGGNLTMLCHLAVAGRLPDLRGAILLIEDINEAPYRLDRTLTALRMGGYLEGLAGVVCGNFGLEIEDAALLHDLLLDGIRDSTVPILAGVAYGHHGPNRLVPLGVAVELDSDAREVRFLTAGVC